MSVTCFPFHTIVKVKVWKLLKCWKTSCDYNLCLLWHVVFSISKWKWKFECFERQVAITPCVLCDSFPFHTIVKVNSWNFWKTSCNKFWKTNCDYTSCSLWQVFLFIPLWMKVWKPLKFRKTNSDYTLSPLWQVCPLHPIVKVKVWKLLKFWKTSCDYTLCLLWQVFPLHPIVRVKVWKLFKF